MMHMVSIVFQRKTCLYQLYVQEYYIFKASGKQTKKERKREREAAVLNMRSIVKNIHRNSFK